MSKVRMLLIIAYVLMTMGCMASVDPPQYPMVKVDLSPLQIGMSKQEVIEAIGKPYNVIGAKRFENGVVEVWDYRCYGANVVQYYIETQYWLYFLDGKLEQWGQPGDWEKEATRIYEIRVR